VLVFLAFTGLAGSTSNLSSRETCRQAKLMMEGVDVNSKFDVNLRLSSTAAEP
jgi:hypothetical protein